MHEHEGHRERMKQRFLKSGLENMAPHEVLEMLLFYTNARRDTNPLGHALISEFGSVANVLDADIEHLCSVKGIGENTAIFIKFISQLNNYYSKSKWKERPRLLNVTEVGTYLVDYIGDKTTEGFYVVCFDVSKKVIITEKVSEGSIAKIPVDPRKVVATALKHRASSVVLAHNHPSGTLHPSNEDMMLTKKLCQALESIDIEVTDHIIVAARSFVSLSERGLMP